LTDCAKMRKTAKCNTTDKVPGIFKPAEIVNIETFKHIICNTLLL
jgi:hypothetical protein